MLKRYILIPLASFLARHPVLSLTAALLYLAAPWDAVPEAFTGVIGFLDDLIVLAAVFWLTRVVKRKKNPAGPNVIETTAEIVKDEDRKD